MLTTLRLPNPATVPPIPNGRRVDVATADQLLDAVENARDGDVIVLAAGTYTLVETLTIGHSIVLYGDPVRPENVKLMNAHANTNLANTIATTNLDTQIKLIGLDIFSRNNVGVLLSRDTEAEILFCHIHDCEWSGIASLFGVPSVKITVKHCIITNNRIGIHVLGELIVTNSRIRVNREDGIVGRERQYVAAALGPRVAVITDSEITQNGNSGIVVQTGTITNCRITHNGGNGITIGSGNVTGCEISQNRNTGIFVVTAGRDSVVNVTSCEIQDNRGNGVEVGWDARGDFRENTLRGNQKGNWLIRPQPANATRIGNRPNE